jgi:uncharacterized repeat protein (TIGR01451 family)
MRGRRTAAGAALVTAIVLAGCQPVQPWRSAPLAPGEGGAAAGSSTTELAWSPDGTKVAFVTAASDLGPVDTNGWEDVYVRDLVAGTTTLVSANAAGTDAGEEPSRWPSFNAAGTKVAFETHSSDIVPGHRGTFVRDLVAGTTVHVHDAGSPNFSPTADQVVVAGGQVVVVDLGTGAETPVSVSPDGRPGDGESQLPRFSPDGTKVAFQSYASNLVAGADTNGTGDVFVRDLTTGVTTLASVNAAGTDSGREHSYLGEYDRPAFTADSGRVVFTTFAPDLLAGDRNETFDVVVHDLATGTTEAVSANVSGGVANGTSTAPVVSPDGRRVAFASNANDLVPGVDDAVGSQAYVRDLTTGTTVLASQGPDGAPGGHESSPFRWQMTDAAFNPDGTKLVFPSLAGDLGARDTDACPDPLADLRPCVDLYVHDLRTGATTLVSSTADGSDSGDGASYGAAFSPVDDTIAFISEASDLGPPAVPGMANAYLATLTGADVSVTLDAAPAPVAAGGEVAYTLTVANAGPEAADDAAAALQLPDGVTFAGVAATAGSCAPPPPQHPGFVLCAFGDAPVGPVAEVEVTATVTAAPGATLTAVARADSATAVDAAVANDVRRVDTAVT